MIKKNRTGKAITKLGKTTGTALSMDADGHVIEVPKGKEIGVIDYSNKGIDILTITFPNEDLNKLVDKINELIDKQNGTK